MAIHKNTEQWSTELVQELSRGWCPMRRIGALVLRECRTMARRGVAPGGNHMPSMLASEYFYWKPSAFAFILTWCPIRFPWKFARRNWLALCKTEIFPSADRDVLVSVLKVLLRISADNMNPWQHACLRSTPRQTFDERTVQKYVHGALLQDLFLSQLQDVLVHVFRERHPDFIDENPAEPLPALGARFRRRSRGSGFARPSPFNALGHHQTTRIFSCIFFRNR